ncbi:MAG: hypothetical protein IJW39_04345 [Opitutales bacterium]|nr:hypothetical protein [Opitutales bacterium]
MTDFAKEFLARERHTMLGILCGVAIAHAIKDETEKADAFIYFSKLVEIFSAGAIAYYAFSSKDNLARIRFFLGLSFVAAARYHAKNYK